jgi:hypothetical protein
MPAIFLTSISFGFNLLLNQWDRTPNAFDLGVIRTGSIVASSKAPLLSSQTVVLNVVGVFHDMPTPLIISIARFHRGNTSRIAIDSALYSASIVEEAMQDCNLLLQIMGKFAILMIYPARLFTQEGSLQYL